MSKKLRVFILALFATFGVMAPSASAISGGSISCDKLKSTFSADSSETGSATVVLSENCKIDDIYIKNGQNITLDASGHTLETKINVESGGKLSISSSNTASTISGSISNKGSVSISGGKFTFDPSKYLASGYTTSVEGGFYVVSAKKTSSIIDTSKISATNDNIKNALIKTLEAQATNPDTSTENGRILGQLLNAIKTGHSLSAALNITSVTEVTSALQDVILSETEGKNLGSVSNVSFVVTDTTSKSSVNLTKLAVPVKVTLGIPEAYKSALRERGVEIIHISDNDGEYETDVISGVAFDDNGNLTFETSGFSAFAMAYDGEPITAAAGSGDVPQASAANTTGNTDVVAPDTAGFLGIDLTVYHLLMLVGISLVVIAIIAYAVKRAYIRNKISWK